jgi:zinc protease
MRRAPLAAVVAVALLASGIASAVAVGQNAKWPSDGPPKPLPARAVQFPPYEVRTLPNGLQVVAVLHHEQPMVSMRLIVGAGSAFDPREKVGLAHLTASLLDQGIAGDQPMSALEMNDAIDFIGGEMATGAGTDMSYLSVMVMKDSFATGMRMLSNMARFPAFALPEIDRQKQQMLSSQQVRFEDPAFIADAVFDRLVYGSHPYGLPELGTPQTITTISRDDLVAFHDRYFAPNNAILAVVGDLTAEEAFDQAGQIFGAWPRKNVTQPTFTAPPNPARRVVVVNKPDAVQTEVRVGHIGVKRNTSDYMQLNLTLRILGGEGANRLHQVLRTERSLTYGAQAEMDTLKESGDFEAETNTRTEATAEVVRLIVDEFYRLQRERVSQRELGDVKTYLTGSFPLTIETPNAIATQVLNVLFYGLPIRDLQTFRDRVNAVTVEEIERVARYYLHPDRLSIVLVGNAAQFTPQLRRIGLSNFDVIDMNDLDLMSSDFKKHGSGQLGQVGQVGRLGQVRLVSQVTAIQPDAGEAARALLDKVIAAKGGFETLRNIKTIKAVTTAESDTRQGRVTTETTTYLQYPNRVRIEARAGGQTMLQIFDGARGWVKDPRGTSEVPERMARELGAGFRRDVIALLLAAHDGSVKARLLPDVKDDAGSVYHALEFSAPDLEPSVLYIDPSTNLIAKQTYVAGGPNQPIVEELYSDYKATNGVQVAFTARVRQGGQQVLERRVTDIQINAPLDPALFRRP